MRINLLDCFGKTAADGPGETAVVHKTESITFGDLQARAQKLANQILDQAGDVINTPVAVFLPKEIGTVVADLGILYSANPFMNLDVKTPQDRIRNIIQLVRPCAVITSSRFVKKLDGIELPVILMDGPDLPVGEGGWNLRARRERLIDTDPLCLINTSGSTGTPKGVVLNHRSFFDFMDWSIGEFSLDGSETIGSLSPVVFDIFDFELCLMMMRGATIVLLDASLASFPARLLETLHENHVNFIFWVPSIMVNIANMDLFTKMQPPALKLVWFAGEVFPTKPFLYWYDNMPDTTFVNLYGPIEITLDCTFHVVKDRPDEDKPLPIGVPCRNTDILILNEEDELCKTGEEGELCVRGTSLAMGYYNNAEKTNAAFVQNPLNRSYPELIYRTGDIVCRDENALIQFRGRKDSLVKHMGYRIELGEIEHVIINELGLVKYCCAVYQFDKKEIILYYEKAEEISGAEFRKMLMKKFPAYMIPAVYIRMDLLPRNTNGKIDRLLLKNKINEVNGDGKDYFDAGGNSSGA